MPGPFKVDLADTVNFSKQWTLGGIAIPIGAEHIRFANDYANLVINQFIILCAQQADARAKAEHQRIEEANKPKIVLTD